MVKKELWFIAEGEDGSNYWVRKKGRSIYISGPDGHEHLCHASVTNQDKVKSEILTYCFPHQGCKHKTTIKILHPIV